MVRRILNPAPALAAALLAVLLAVQYLDHGFSRPTLIAGAAVAILGLAFVVGLLMFGRSPYAGGLLMESSLGVLICAAAVAGAFLVWFAIAEAPPEKASVRTKEVYAAVSAALTAYLGALIIEPEGELWNPVKSAIKSKFSERFTDRGTVLEKDADDAVRRDNGYSAQAPAHSGHVVAGWGWDDRRLRTKHIQDQLNAGS